MKVDDADDLHNREMKDLCKRPTNKVVHKPSIFEFLNYIYANVVF